MCSGIHWWIQMIHDLLVLFRYYTIIIPTYYTLYYYCFYIMLCVQRQYCYYCSILNNNIKIPSQGLARDPVTFQLLFLFQRVLFIVFHNVMVATKLSRIVDHRSPRATENQFSTATLTNKKSYLLDFSHPISDHW